jgi:hypothetical protein
MSQRLALAKFLKIKIVDWLQPNPRSSDEEKFKSEIWLKPVVFDQSDH